MATISWRVLTNELVRNWCVEQIDLQQVEELWPSRSPPDHPIESQACRSVHPCARAFRPNLPPFLCTLHQVDSSAQLVCRVRSRGFQVLQLRIDAENESRPPRLQSGDGR